MNFSKCTWIALLFVVAFGFLISARGLNEPDEGRYVEIAREMLVSGDFLVPRLKGVPHYAKPPFTYWSIAISMRLFGVNEFAARLPGFLAALLVGLVLKNLVIRMNGSKERSWLLLLFLAATIEFFALAQIVTTDMLLCAAICVAMWARWNSMTDGHRLRWAVVFWLAIGIGFLIKGPIVAVVVFSSLVATAVLERSWRPLAFLRATWGLPLALGLAAPWFWLVIEQQPGLTDFFFGDEVLGRVKSGRGRAKPIFYFMLVFPLVLLPWTWSIAAAGRRLIAAKRQEAQYLFGWILGPFICFSLASSKLWTYMLPLVPPAILVLALGIDLDHRKKRVAALASGFILTLACLVLISEERSLELGNNNGYRSFLKSIPAEQWRGQQVTAASNNATKKPIFLAGVGPKIATYRFRCLSASFYLFQSRPQFVPIFGNKSLWEWQNMQAQDTPGTLDDLVAELLLPQEFVVLTKARYRNEIENALGRELRLLRESGTGRARVVALCNR